MLKTVLTVLCMIMKVLLCIALTALTVYCLVTVFTEKLWPGGLIRIAAIAASVVLFKRLIRPPRDE